MTLLGCSVDGEVPYLVYEFLPNGTLEDAIEYKVKLSCLYITIWYNASMRFQHVVCACPIYQPDFSFCIVPSCGIFCDMNVAHIATFNSTTCFNLPLPPLSMNKGWVFASLGRCASQ